MSESSSLAHPQSQPQSQNLPPPAPPLPPPRLGPLQRFIAPLGLSKGSRNAGDHDHVTSHVPTPTRPVTRPSYASTASRSNVHHRTGIPIAAIDVNKSKTHAILAGRDILKTVSVGEGKATEDLNLRSSIVSYASTHGSPQGDAATRRRDYLPARDVKWSTGELCPHVVATAASNGRISLYDVNAAGSRIELAWLHEHTGQVNKIDIDPFAGRYLLSASQDKTVKLWDIRDPKSTKSKSRFDVRAGVRHVCWSPKEGNDFDFAVCADGGMIQNWDARNPLGPKLSIHAHERGCYSLDWHPDGSHVVSGGFDRYVRVWDFKSESRRQKPVFHFRVPQAVRSVNWRPASESVNHVWQTSQLATTYHDGDPRVHVWDLKRPFLPVVELAHFSRPANDFLWASADYLWTAGDDGVFGQHDMAALPHTEDTISPVALTWLPGGQNAMFLEERLTKSDIQFDPSGFLSIPKEKLSSGDDSHQAPTQVAEEYEDPSHRTSITSSARSRQTRELSFRSDISRTSSPPERRHIQQLDKTVNAGRLLMQNHQVGALGLVPTAPGDEEVTAFLANNYALVASEADRRSSPELILPRLEACFLKNADVCDKAALHRLAQSWRIIAAVVVPELQDWAEANRAARGTEMDQRKGRRKLQHPSLKSDTSPSFAKVSARDRNPRLDTKDNKVMSNLFRGLKDSGRHSEQDNSSNVTTPLARPLPDSPKQTPRHQRSQDSSSSLGNVEDIPPLPESLLNSHATAAAASYALHEDAGNESPSPPTSPRRKRRENLQAPDKDGTNLVSASSEALDRMAPVPRASPFLQAQRQEERRAALRDYRAQARPIFSLETQTKSPAYDRNLQHNSAESFPMFSASTGSSHKARSMGQSETSKPPDAAPTQRQDSWLSREDSTESSSTSAWRSSKIGQDSFDQSVSMRDFSMGSDAVPFKMDETPDLGKNSSSPAQVASVDSKVKTQPREVAVAPLPNALQFESESSPAQSRFYNFNPLLDTTSHQAKAAAKAVAVSVKELDDSQLACEQFIVEDFRPIDMYTYVPKLPFAWTAFPLLCQLISYDLDNGVACAQFATHLLLHLSPYFFGKLNTSGTMSLSQPETLADRLMVPELAGRVIESTMRKHLSFLYQLQLFVPLAALRRSCVALGYAKLGSFTSQQSAEKTISSSDPNVVTIACSSCGSSMASGSRMCGSCMRARTPCPVCCSLRPAQQRNTKSTQNFGRREPAAWVVCHSCGHGSHMECMQKWQLRAGSDGNCPTPGCGCDCAPGTLRIARVERQAKAYEERKLIRGTSTSSAKRDSIRASPSPAVDRTRAVMRAASGDRGTQSSDERGIGRRASGRASVGGGGVASSSRKSVRLVTPGEERNPSSRQHRG